MGRREERKAKKCPQVVLEGVSLEGYIDEVLLVPHTSWVPPKTCGLSLYQGCKRGISFVCVCAASGDEELLREVLFDAVVTAPMEAYWTALALNVSECVRWDRGGEGPPGAGWS